MSNGISAHGAMVAALSGSMLGMGYALLHNDKDVKDVIRRTVGGAFCMAGLYLWAPSALRRAWLE